jgi:hypothetical protein
MYADVAGQWVQLPQPQLLSITPGTHVDLSQSVDVYLAGTPAWRVYGRGRECDMPGMQECPVSEIGANDDGGIFEAVFHGSDGVGRHTGAGTAEGCDEVAHGPCYTLTYRVEDLGVLNSAVQAAPAPAPAPLKPASRLPATGDEPWPLLAAALLVAGLGGRALVRRQALLR